MALPAKRSSPYSTLMIVLLIGLSALAWISTYSGMLQLIAASSGDIGLPAKIAIGLAVLMLQGMIVYILDALFSGQLRLVLYPIYIIGYIILVLISVAFAFRVLLAFPRGWRPDHASSGIFCFSGPAGVAGRTEPP